MSFLWPQYLWLAALLPLLVWAYVWLLKRRARASLPFAALALARRAAQPGWRRHLPPALLLLACAVLLLATARPVARVTLPWARATVVMAMDVSLSMRVADVKPTRLAAAQEAAKAFLAELPKPIEVALVTFAGSTHVTQRATLDREALVAAIDAFQMQRGTAVGDAIALSLSELFPEDHIRVGPAPMPGMGRSLDDKARPPPREVTPVEPGSFQSAAILLLTDGRRTTGMDTLEAARMAAIRGVRVHVVGLGVTDSPQSTNEGMGIYLQLDEPTLREVARITGGEYHHAGSAEKLRAIYENMGTRMQVQTREMEVSALFALLAALLALGGAGLSLAWHGRVA